MKSKIVCLEIFFLDTFAVLNYFNYKNDVHSSPIVTSLLIMSIHGDGTNHGSVVLKMGGNENVVVT